MPLGSEWAVLVSSLTIMSWASVRLTTALERIGARWRLSEGLLGVVTALGADTPEISSAFVAVSAGHHEVGLGVVLGSNIFNLAGLLGLSALVAGRVNIGRQGLWLNGAASLLVSLVVVALVLQWIPVWSCAVLLALVLVPYFSFLTMQPAQIARLALPSRPRRFLEMAIGHAHRDTAKRPGARPAGWTDAAWVVLAVALIVGSSVGAVHSAVAIGTQWGLSQGVIGTLVLAALTSIPNAIASVRLAREGRGAAVVSATLNSNTLNILAGICLPALVLGFAAPSPRIIFAALWLVGMKLFALAAASRRHGLHRISGAVLVVLYLVFAGYILRWP